jgi:multidrug transporter EmrE-like cation transporter
MSRRHSVGLVFVCTLIGAIGQIFIKLGAKGTDSSRPWGTVDGAWHNLYAMATNLNLVIGYSLYALMTVLFVFALRDEELSVVYPIIALSYVWVAGLSIWFFRESINAPKLIGIAVIVLGVAVLGRSGVGK